MIPTTRQTKVLPSVFEESSEKRHYFNLTILSCLLITLLLCTIYWFQPLAVHFLTLRTTDLLLSQSPGKVSSSHVAIIAIDDHSLEQYGQWPWSRTLLAELLNKIAQATPKTVGIDLLIAEKERTENTLNRVGLRLSEGDQALTEALASGPFTLGYQFLFEKSDEPAHDCQLNPFHSFNDPTGNTMLSLADYYTATGVVCTCTSIAGACNASGFLNGTPDRDGVFRRLPLLIEFNNKLYPSLALSLLMQWQENSSTSLSLSAMKTPELLMGKNRLILDEYANLRLGPALDTVTADISATDVLKDIVPLDRLQNKIVLVGLTAAGLTPGYINTSGETLNSLEIYQQALENIIQQQHTVRTSSFLLYEIAVSLVLTGSLLLIYLYCSSKLMLWFAGAAIVAPVPGVGLLYQTTGWLCSFLLPVVTVGCNTLILLLSKSRQTRNEALQEADHAIDRLQENEQNLKSILQVIPDIVFRLDRHGRIIFISAAIEKYTVKKNALLGQPIMDFVYPEDRDKATYRINERRTGERATNDFEIRLLLNREDGEQKEDEIRYFSVTAEGLYQDAGDGDILFQGTQGIIRDITEKKQLEHALLESKKLEAIGNLASGVAHDLNNILGGLVTYPDFLLLDLDESDPMHEKISIIKKSGERAAAIVQDLLTLARRNVQVDQVCDLNMIITDYLESIEFKQFKKKHSNIDIAVDLDPKPPLVKGSGFHLAKVIMNIINNAFEAMPDGGQLAVKTCHHTLETPYRGLDYIPKGEYIAATFSDTGVGIPGGDIEQIFQPFYSSKTMGNSGTGLGMTVIRATIQDHKGYLDIKSSPGKGTTIKLYFPSDNALLLQQGFSRRLKYAAGSESILIVDDVQDQRDVAAEMLRRLGYQVSTVSGGLDAIEWLKDHPVDLILLDMIMPGGPDGLETYQHIVKLYPNQKAIITSGFSESSQIKELQTLGISGYIQKPYTMEELSAVVRAELDRKQ